SGENSTLTPFGEVLGLVEPNAPAAGFHNVFAGTAFGLQAVELDPDQRIVGLAGRVAVPLCGNSLVSRWPGEGDARDIVGDNDGTLVNGVTFAPGRVGQAFSFDGASFVKVPQAVSLEPATITAAAWVRSDHPPDDGVSYVLSKGALGCSAASYAL